MLAVSPPYERRTDSERACMPRLRGLPGILASRGGGTLLVAGGSGLYTTGNWS